MKVTASGEADGAAGVANEFLKAIHSKVVADQIGERLGVEDCAMRLYVDNESREMRAILIRRELTDAQWRRIEPLIPGKEGDRGRHGKDNRLFVDAVLWLVRAGIPWRDLPHEFGNWNSVWRRFRRWTKTGVWKSLFDVLNEDPDFEYLIVDSNIVRAQQHASRTSSEPASIDQRGAGNRIEHQNHDIPMITRLPPAALA
jgi:putative transposase